MEHTRAFITPPGADVNLLGSVTVYDVWAQASLGTFTGSYTAKAVPMHGTAFLRLAAVRGHAGGRRRVSGTRVS